MKIIQRDDLKRGGFAGLTETRLVMDSTVFGRHAEPGTWNGFGNFVYMADARFLATGETHMHAHREIDVISVMIEGRLKHEGSLEHGQEMQANDVQVQRAGGEGFSHNEINPDNYENRMIQLWVKPERRGERAGYKFYHLHPGKLNKVYGGPIDQNETLDSNTHIEIGLFTADQEFAIDYACQAYLTKGAGLANNIPIKEGDLIETNTLHFKAGKGAQIIVISTN